MHSNTAMQLHGTIVYFIILITLDPYHPIDNRTSQPYLVC